MIWLVGVIVILMLGSALAVLLLKNPISAVAAASVVSLALSVLFVILRAPDVAMTEAAVGGGLGSLILALSLRRLGLWHVEGEKHGPQPNKETKDA